MLLAAMSLASCSMFDQDQTPNNRKPEWYIDHTKYAALTPGEASIEVNLSEQQAYLFNKAGEVVIGTDVSTGVPGHATPRGNFRIMEKLKVKHSNMYGTVVDSNGNELGKSWEFQSLPSGARYEGTAMPYWLRVTAGGVGMHVGKFEKRAPNSFGCIRVPADIQPLIYAKAQVGTPIAIVGSYPGMFGPSVHGKTYYPQFGGARPKSKSASRKNAAVLRPLAEDAGQQAPAEAPSAQQSANSVPAGNNASDS